MKFFILLILSLSLAFGSVSAAGDYLSTAILFKESGEIDKAIEVLTKADQTAQIKAYSAKLNYLDGNSKKAREIFKGLKSKNWSDLIYLGLAYEDLGQTNKAVSTYLNSLKIKQNTIALFRLAKIYRKQARYRKAIESFRRLIKLDSSIRISHYYLGSCLLKKGQDKEAYKHLAKAVSFYPESKSIAKLFTEAKSALGEGFFTTKQKLKDQARKAVKLSSYIAQEKILDITIGLAKELRQFSFSCGGPFTISDKKSTFSGQANTIYTVVVDRKNLVLKDYSDTGKYAVFIDSINLSSSGKGKQKYPFYLLDITYGKGNFWHKVIDRVYRGDIEAVIKNGTLTLINRLSVEEYLYGVLSAEIPHSSGKQALGAQAVAARTLVFRNRRRHHRDGFDFCADVHCQVYHGVLAETKATTSAIKATKGEILKFNDKPVETFYHSNCGGCLASDVFGEEEYLANKIDFSSGQLPKSAYQREKWFIESPAAFCSKNSGATYRWQRIYDPEDFLITFGFELKELKAFLSRETGECFHHKEIELVRSKQKKSLKGGLRIRNYFDKLRSSAFMAEIKSSADNFSEMVIIWGAGFGHGTGLCQEGAIAMAKEGYSYKEILEHYYPKAELEKVY